MTQTPEQPSFPMVNINVTPEGMALSIIIGPGTAITQHLSAQAMDDITKKWRETRRQSQSMIDFAKHVQATKNN